MSCCFDSTSEISFSVRGGGHDWAERSIRGEVVADLTRMREVFIEGLVTTLGGSGLSINVAEASSARGLTAIKGIIVSVGKAVSVTRLLRSLDCKVWFGTRQHPGFGSYTCGRANRLNRCETRAGPLLGYPRRRRQLWGYNRRLKLHSIPDISDGIIALPWRKQRKYYVL